MEYSRRHNIWTGIWLLCGSALLYAIVVVGFVIPRIETWFGWFPTRIMLVACLLVVMFVIIKMRRNNKAFCRLARERGGAVCIECGYLLPQGDETGVCPECGQAYTLKGNRRHWEGLAPAIHDVEPRRKPDINVSDRPADRHTAGEDTGTTPAAGNPPT